MLLNLSKTFKLLHNTSAASVWFCNFWIPSFHRCRSCFCAKMCTTCELLWDENIWNLIIRADISITLRSFSYIRQLGANMFMNTPSELLSLPHNICQTVLSNTHQRLLLPNGLNKWSSTALEQGLFYFFSLRAESQSPFSCPGIWVH